jgi:hypothetical protein
MNARGLIYRLRLNLTLARSASIEVAPATLARSASKGILGKNACIERPSLARRASVCGKNDTSPTSRSASEGRVSFPRSRFGLVWCAGIRVPISAAVGVATLLCFALCFVTSAEAQSGQPSTYKGWKAHVLKNDFVRLHIVPEIGGRVIQFALGEKEFFWVNPALTGKTSPKTGLGPDGGWLNYGGDKLWPAPQGWDNDQQWPGPPDAVLDGQPYRVDTGLDSASIRLTSRDDPRSGIRFSRRIRLHPRSTRVSIEATMTNIDDKPRRWGIWAHTQLDAGLPGSDDYNRLMRAWCPINPRSHFDRGYEVIFGEKDNPSFDVDVERGLMKVSYQYKVGKIGLDSDAGWVATVDGRKGDVFVQRFKFEPDKAYPDGSSVEFWHNGVGRIFAYNEWMQMPADRDENPYVFESEVLSPYARMRSGESHTWRYDWYACRIGGDFPVVDCSEAGIVSEQLTCLQQGGRMRLRGRFGVFHPGRLVLEACDAKGVVLATELLVPAATPLKPVVLDRSLELPAVASSVALILQNTEGHRIGEIARSGELAR